VTLDPDGPEGAREELRGAWVLLLAIGMLSVAAGIALLAWPAIGLVTLAWVSGIFLILDAIYEFIAALSGRSEHRGTLSLLGVLSLIAGLFLVRHPVAGVVLFALLLGFWLIVFGAVRFVEAFGRREPRAWDLVIGAVEVLAGIVIVAIPGIGVRTLAILVGIAFVLRGAGTAAVGWALHIGR
jgi:uncharacterized membrane protein HdeD (DUF308 family)